MNVDHLKKLQHKLVDHMLTRDIQDSHIRNDIIDTGSINAERRLSIYRNGYRLRLKATIETDHPVLGVYLGDDLFDLMVENYIDFNPSQYPSLRQFADKLPGFLKAHGPFNQYPIIAELAHFERLLITSFDAADSERSSASDLVAIPSQNWPEMRLRFHPSVQQINFDWNCVDIWQLIKADNSPPEAQSTPSNWLIWRNEERLTEFCSLDRYEYHLLSLASQDLDVSVLCDFLLENFSEEETLSMIVKYLQKWLVQGIVAELFK